MSRDTEPFAGPKLLHNIGMAPRASIVWRGLGRGPLSDDTMRIRAAGTQGTWMHLSISIGPHDPRHRRDWNTAAALLNLLEPGHGLGEDAAGRRLVDAIEAHAAALDWPPCLLAGRADDVRWSKVTLDHVPTTFVGLAKSTGNLWMRKRPVRLAPLHAPTLGGSGDDPAGGVRWDQLLWFPDGIPEDLLTLAARQHASQPAGRRQAR